MKSVGCLLIQAQDMIDFSREKFDFSNDAWLKMQKKEIDPNLYGISRAIYRIGFDSSESLVLIWHRYWEPNIQFINMHQYWIMLLKTIIN